jgi:hypothetical protein
VSNTTPYVLLSGKRLCMYLHGSDTYFGSMFVLILFGKKKKTCVEKGKRKKSTACLHKEIQNILDSGVAQPLRLRFLSVTFLSTVDLASNGGFLHYKEK